MRDHTKLRAFELADQLALLSYQYTHSFPQEEQFGLVSQIRRCAVSIPSNIVEGSARNTEKEYLRFLDIAYGSAKELAYQFSLSYRLGYLSPENHRALSKICDETCKALNGLIRSLRNRNIS